MTLPIAQLAYMDMIRGFVAVGRRMSVTLGAEDLCLTQSAVSRQIHSLEAALGFKLLERGHRSIAFTAEGERLFRVADATVYDLQAVLGEICPARGRRPVTITASTGVAGLWLTPRIRRFQDHSPRIDVRIAAVNRRSSLRADGIDIAIRYCAEDAAPAGAVRLFGETIAPVASPLIDPPSLMHSSIDDQTLLEFDDARRPWLQWSDWFAAAGRQRRTSHRLIRFNQYDQVIQAAVAGQGIALGRLELLGHFLARGQLRVISSVTHSPTPPHAYWLMAMEREPRNDVRLLMDWVQQEARDAVQR